MGTSPQSYLPGFKAIGPLVPENKIFEGFLPYMDTAAIFIKCREQTIVPPSHEDFIWNFASIGRILEEKTFENVDRQ